MKIYSSDLSVTNRVLLPNGYNASNAIKRVYIQLFCNYEITWALYVLLLSSDKSVNVKKV